jgi:hypothetical protein
MKTITVSSDYETIYNGYSFTHIYHSDDPLIHIRIPSSFFGIFIPFFSRMVTIPEEIGFFLKYYHILKILVHARLSPRG